MSDFSGKSRKFCRILSDWCLCVIPRGFPGTPFLDPAHDVCSWHDLTQFLKGILRDCVFEEIVSPERSLTKTLTYPPLTLEGVLSPLPSFHSICHSSLDDDIFQRLVSLCLWYFCNEQRGWTLETLLGEISFFPRKERLLMKVLIKNSELLQLCLDDDYSLFGEEILLFICDPHFLSG